MGNEQPSKADEIAAEKARLEVEKLSQETRPGWLARYHRFIQLWISLAVPISIAVLTMQQNGLAEERTQLEREREKREKAETKSRDSAIYVFNVKQKVADELRLQSTDKSSQDQQRLLIWLTTQVPDPKAGIQLLFFIRDYSKYPFIQREADSLAKEMLNSDSFKQVSNIEQADTAHKILIDTLLLMRKLQEKYVDTEYANQLIKIYPNASTQSAPSPNSFPAPSLIHDTSSAYYIDIFWLEGNAKNFERATTARLSLLKAGFLKDRVRVRKLSKLINFRPEYNVLENELRYDNGEEVAAKDASEALKVGMANEKDNILPKLRALDRRRQALYLSIFFVTP
jgi:hypothetical protein